MPAQPGNQTALGNDGGRPRTWDREKIMCELIEWVKLPDSLNLNKFCGTRTPMLDPALLSRWANECDEFKQSYRAAKTILGARREEWLSTDRLHQKAYHLSNHTYDYFNREEDRDYFKYQKELEAKVGKEIAQVANADIAEKLDRMHNQITQLQSSARNSADNTIKSDP